MCVRANFQTANNNFTIHCAGYEMQCYACFDALPPMQPGKNRRESLQVQLQMYAGKNIIILHKENQQNLPQIGKLFLKQSIGLRCRTQSFKRRYLTFQVEIKKCPRQNSRFTFSVLQFFGFKSKNEIFTLTEAVEYGQQTTLILFMFLHFAHSDWSRAKT